VAVSIGRGMDLLGNYVDEDGNSLDKTGKHIDIRDYFSIHGKIERSAQRESEYTKMLSEKLVREFHSLAIVLPSHLVAFVAFEKLWKRHPRLDIYNFLRLPIEEQEINYQEFKEICEGFRNVLFELEKNRKIQTSDLLKNESIDQVIETGVKNVGILHPHRPLLKNKKGDIITKDLNLLYYYHNRLAGYELEKYI